MLLTRKSFLKRSGTAAAAMVATTILGGGTASAGPIPHLKNLLATLRHAQRELDAVSAALPPGPCSPETLADLQALVAATTLLHDGASRTFNDCVSR